MVNDVELRRSARERLQQGKLPANEPHRISAEPGRGESCDLCDLPITHGEVQYRVDLLEEVSPTCHRFHSACHAAWQQERRGG